MSLAAKAIAAKVRRARIEDVLGNPSPDARVDGCINLCLRLLELVPPIYDTADAEAALRAAL